MLGPERLSVLYVEDDEDDVLLLQQMVEDAGMHWLELSSEQDPQAALLRAKTGSHDLYILDYNLGSIKGLDLLQRIRKAGVDAPVIFLTGASMEDLDMKVLEEGASDFIEKARLNPQQLRRSVLYAWSNHQNAVKNRQIQSLEEVRRLAGSIAHEFSQPLQILQISLEIQERLHPDQEWLMNAGNALERLRTLTGQIRKLTQLRSKPYLNTRILDLDQSSSGQKSA